WSLLVLVASLSLVGTVAAWYGRRVRRSRGRWPWAAPAAACAVLAATAALGIGMQPMVFWLLPGSSVLPQLAPDGGSPYSITAVVDGRTAATAELHQSGLIIAPTATVARLAR